ncbi:MAG TPA: 16S rRNA (guanine(527)-N(7))-methyltransferase RsmG [bacterium]|nr:16S rRNA (guanine(527)-N(7))-methyltransferase RsmG [bacterium]
MNISVQRKISQKLVAAEINLQQKQLEDLNAYHQLILEWSNRTNLISLPDRDRIVEKHFFESMAVLNAFDLKKEAAVLDVGTGCGFPGLPIALLRPDLKMTLLESRRMKALFLKEAVSQLKLKNVIVMMERCEKLCERSEFAQQFDYIFSRTVASLSVVYQWIKDLLKNNGRYIAWKGGDMESEVKQLLNHDKNVVIKIVKLDERFVAQRHRRCLISVQKRLSGGGSYVGI